jgi:hypothetical protein
MIQVAEASNGNGNMDFLSNGFKLTKRSCRNECKQSNLHLRRLRRITFPIRVQPRQVSSEHGFNVC